MGRCKSEKKVKPPARVPEKQITSVNNPDAYYSDHPPMKEIIHYYLVDLENVRINGLRGIDLTEADAHVRVFVSQNVRMMATKELREDMLHAKAGIDTLFCSVCEKNAMDFQIAAYFGEVIVRPATQRISIISADKGFRALFDYGSRIREEVQIYQATSILEALAAAAANYNRVGYAVSKKNRIDLETAVSEVNQRRTFKEELRRKVGDNRLPAVEEMLCRDDIPPKDLYTGLLHILGRSSGIETYRFLKAQTKWQ